MPVRPVRAALFLLTLAVGSPVIAQTVNLQCGEQAIAVTFTTDSARVVAGGRSYELFQVRSASGARYEAKGDPSTSFWNKGRNGTLVLAGRTYPECTPAPPDPFTATGVEPGWRLDIRGTHLTLVAAYGATTISIPSATRAPREDGWSYTGSSDGVMVSARIVQRVCRDAASGMPKPFAAEVAMNGTVLEGCGGDPAALFTGVRWVVVEMNGSRTLETAPVTLTFDASGRVAGIAACNNFTAIYTITGEGLSVVEPIATRKACAADILQLEAAFLNVLVEIRHIDIGADGSLVLSSPDGRTLVARR